MGEREYWLSIAEQKGISEKLFNQRLNREWPLKAAATKPLNYRYNSKNKKWLVIAKENGVNPGTYYARIASGMSEKDAATSPLMKPGPRNNKEAIYAVYKGEDPLAIGTARECAEHLGLEKEYIQWLATPSNQRRIERLKDPSKGIVAFRVDDDEEDLA